MALVNKNIAVTARQENGSENSSCPKLGVMHLS